jgi:RNA 3'-terminal phosphate cyclase (ATP)
MIDVDGSTMSGSGMIVRDAMAYAATTGTSIRVFNARARRPNPGLRPQHLCAVEAVRRLVEGTVDGARIGSREFTFVPGDAVPQGSYWFDVGTAGSATALSLALLPVVAAGTEPVELELVGGLFQDQAPSPFHLQHVLAPLLGRIGLEVLVTLARPGYIPTGGGQIRLRTHRAGTLAPLVAERQCPVRRLWGIALASHLAQRQVATRMAQAARHVLGAAGYDNVLIDEVEDVTASQPGAGLALFADFADGVRVGADRAGARGRSAERIGSATAHQLLETIRSGATVDRFAADQMLVFAALAAGRTRICPPSLSDHVRTGLWLMDLFGCGTWRLEGRMLTVDGGGKLAAAHPRPGAPVARSSRGTSGGSNPSTWP